jgi:hypothetical protein
VRMRRAVTAGVVAVAASSLFATHAGAADNYRPYALIRQQLRGCVLDHTWHQLGADSRARCKRLRPLYVLWSTTESAGFHVHCLTARCPAAPIGEPDPRAALPAGARVFRP